MTAHATVAGEVIGGPLTELDLEHLAQSWVHQGLAELACIRRVTHAQGVELFDSKNRQDLSGLMFPCFLPGESRPCSFRLRPDNPPLDATTGKPAFKYLSRAGAGNRLYFVPGVSQSDLQDTSLPVVITEGEKKTLALHRLALHEAEAPRWLPVGMAGVWAWRSAAEKTTNANGNRVDVKGPIADLGLIKWAGRTVYIVFDSDVSTNDKVRAARQALAVELKGRGAEVWFVAISASTDKLGIDDFIFKNGPAAALKLFEQAQRAFEVPVEAWLKESGLLDLVAPVDTSKLESVLAWLHGHVGELASFRRSLAKSALIERLKELKKPDPSGLAASVFGRESKDGEESGNGKAIAFAEISPANEPVNGAALLSEIQNHFSTHAVLPDGGPAALALWTVHTYGLDAACCSPLLAITSPEKRCGKTLVLELIESLANRPVMAANITSAALFRTVEKYQPTLLVDEADTFLSEHEELRGVINSGHRRASAFAVRCCGDEQEPKTFSTWAPKAIAAIGRLPETIQDRSIMIPMKRRAPGETAKRFRRDRLESELRRIQSQCVRWVKDNLSNLRAFDPEEVNFLDDRQQDSWRPLFSIAEVAGGDWPETARESARLLSVSGAEGETSVRVQALADLRDLFKRGKDQLSSLDVVKALAEMEERPWPEFGKQKKPITQRQLAALLRPFGIRPKQFREGEKTRGYKLEECQDSFSRYLGVIDPVQPVQPTTDAGFQAKRDPVQQETCTGSNLATSDTKESAVPDVPDQKGGNGQDGVVRLTQAQLAELNAHFRRVKLEEGSL